MSPLPAPTPFPTLQNSAMSSMMEASSGGSQSQPGAELIAAIKKAFPDSSSLPVEIKEALDKTEVAVTKDLHRATSALCRAQKSLRELEEAKEKHRTQWLTHLKDALQSWQQQMQSYEDQQQSFKDAIAKAKTDLDQSHRSIQVLNAKAAGKQPPQPAVREPEELGPPQGEEDPEEKNLRKQVHQALAQCALKVSEKLNITDSPGSFVVRLAFDCRELGSIFGTGKNILMTHLDDLQISDESKQYVGTVTNLFDIQQADRLLIYVDGSSDPKHRHHHPEFAEHFGHTDAWSFVVLGERYDTGQLSFFGWTSQKICYDQTAGFYSGVTRLGADIAEREALIWAALWRLQLDSSIPTTFCYDCVSAGRFASGQQGAKRSPHNMPSCVDYIKPCTVLLVTDFFLITMSKDIAPAYGMILQMRRRNYVYDKLDSTGDKILTFANGLLLSRTFGSSLDPAMAFPRYTLMAL